MDQKEILIKTIEKVKSSDAKKVAFVGFDGFIDEILDVVKKRIDPDNYQKVETIKEFSDLIASSAGFSMNIELFRKQVKLGGNGPILAQALRNQGIDVIYIGALGKDSIHPVFTDFTMGLQEFYSLTDPGFTEALEFLDGKIMQGKMSELGDVNWQHLIEKVSEPRLYQLISRSHLLAVTNWTMLPGLNSIIRGVVNILRENSFRKPLFIDLTDPQKRSKRDILEILDLLARSQDYADVLLGLNERESNLIARILGIMESDLVIRADRIRKKFGYSVVVIHPLQGAAGSSAGFKTWIDGPYTEDPILSTGAGDNFNAGFCNGYIRGFNLTECLLNGVFVSGYYVRKGSSPNRFQLVEFMDKWLKGGID